MTRITGQYSCVTRLEEGGVGSKLKGRRKKKTKQREAWLAVFRDRANHQKFCRRMRFPSKVHVPPSTISSAACLGGPVPGHDSQSKELGYSSWSSVEARTRLINAELQFTEYSRGLGFCEIVVYLTVSLRSAPSLVVIRLLEYSRVQASILPSFHPPIRPSVAPYVYGNEK